MNRKFSSEEANQAEHEVEKDNLFKKIPRPFTMLKTYLDIFFSSWNAFY